MPRPSKCRRICTLPRTSRFGPPEPSDDTPKIFMTLDEFETIRLIDYLGYDQEDCAAQMGVARTTIQAVYNRARRKLAETLVTGSVLQIEGGNYMLCSHSGDCCGKNCGEHSCHGRRCQGEPTAGQAKINRTKNGGCKHENCSNL